MNRDAKSEEPVSLTVRTATPDDRSRVTGLLEASYPVLMRKGYDQPVLSAALPAMTRANPALLSSGTYYVAETERRRIVGCGGWTLERPGTGEIEPGLGHVRHFATHPDWIGRGVGRSIYAACARAARAADVTRFECYSSLNAEGFYAALGFVAVRPVDIRLGPNIVLPSILMRRSIRDDLRR
jgi:GNAT superfamily N-acetyltransferase